MLNGGAGNDTLESAMTGNDSYYVDSAGGRGRRSGTGWAPIGCFASASYTLAAGVSVETLTTNNSVGTVA